MSLNEEERAILVMHEYEKALSFYSQAEANAQIEIYTFQGIEGKDAEKRQKQTIKPFHYSVMFTLSSNTARTIKSTPKRGTHIPQSSTGGRENYPDMQI